MKNRILWIDYARAIGMVLIIVGHSLGQKTYTLGGSMVFMVNVSIFFVISGYLFKPRKFFFQLRKLFNNLLLPYIFTSVIFAIVSFVVNHGAGMHFFQSQGAVRDVVWSSFWGLGTNSKIIFLDRNVKAIGAIWFLLALFISSILFNILYKLFFKRGRISFVIGGGITLLLSVFGFYIASYGQLPWSMNAALIGAFFMWFGLFIKKAKLIEKFPLICAAVGLLLWVYSSSLGYFWLNIAQADNKFMSLIGGVSGSIFIMVVCLLLEKVVKKFNLERFFDPLSFFGKFSLIILCVHIIELNSTIFSRLLSNMFSNALSSTEMIILLIISRILIVGIVTYIIRYIPIFKQVYVDRNFPFRQ